MITTGRPALTMSVISSLLYGGAVPAEPDVAQHVDAGLERVADVVLGVDVRVDADAVAVRGVDDRLVVVAASGRSGP